MALFFLDRKDQKNNINFRTTCFLKKWLAVHVLVCVNLLHHKCQLFGSTLLDKYIVIMKLQHFKSETSQKDIITHFNISIAVNRHKGEKILKKHISRAILASSIT